MPFGPRERKIAEKIKSTDYYYVGTDDRLEKLRKLQAETAMKRYEVQVTFFVEARDEADAWLKVEGALSGVDDVLYEQGLGSWELIEECVSEVVE